MTEPPQVTIRRIAVEDAAAVAELSGQLGYESAADEIRERIAKLAVREGQAAFVACLAGEAKSRLVGWIDIAVTNHLQSPPYVLIGGLVVQDGLRGLGIGRRLCEAAEAWTRTQGIALVRVTSRSTRGEAHRFYLRDGYTEVKTSKVFEKLLD